jgi:hypothetical protein
MNNHDLYSRQWSIEEIETNIDRLSLKSILYTQTITAEFAVKYILTTDKYACCVEETYYDLDDVLDLQPHITREEILAIILQMYDEKHAITEKQT